jgi:hypothetical protein
MSKTINHSHKAYTKIGKWYNIVLLGSLFFYYLAYAAFWIPELQKMGDRSFVGLIVFSVLTMLAIVIGILGIIKEKSWARWIVVAIYGLVAFYELGVLNRYLLINLLKIVMAVLGIILILQKPKVQEDI